MSEPNWYAFQDKSGTLKNVRIERQAPSSELLAEYRASGCDLVPIRFAIVGKEVVVPVEDLKRLRKILLKGRRGWSQHHATHIVSRNALAVLDNICDFDALKNLTKEGK